MMMTSLLCLAALLACLSITASALSEEPVHECTRPCDDNTAPKTCRYLWVLENYLTLSRACYSCPDNQTDCERQQCVTGDGGRRSVRTVNRVMPGPAIQVCEGDVVEVEVQNRMVMGEGVTIHWHGLHQRGSPHMDGVAMVTQCPVPAGSSFTYRFAAADPGTHFWHGHSGMLLADGLFGSLVIRQPPSRDPHSARYDADLPEHVLVLNDWSSQGIVDTYTDFYHVRGSKRPRSILINGRGRLYDEDGNPTTHTPLAEFKVERDKRYRFRVIGAGFLKCPLRLEMEGHSMQLIASDGRPVEPLSVEYLDVYTGERYDFVLHADRGQEGQEFEVRVRGLIDCQPEHLAQSAVLRYLGNHRQSAALKQGYVSATATASKQNTTANAPLGRTPVAELTSLEPDDRSLTSEPDQRFYLDLQVRGVNNPHFYNPTLYPEGGKGYPEMFTPQINGITNTLPPAPLLTQMGDLDPSLFCNASSVDQDCYQGDKFCECVHRLTVAMGDVLELVLVSSSSAHTSSHPLHAHGHSFRVVAMERLAEDMTVELFKELDEQGEITRRLHRAPYKDTVAVPDGGYAVLRLVADNPGVWYFHCHLTFHVEVGMSFFLHVTGTEGGLPPPPPSFPRCGPWPSLHSAQPINEGSQSTGSAPSHYQPISKDDEGMDSIFSEHEPTGEGSQGADPASSANQAVSVGQHSAGPMGRGVTTVTPVWLLGLVGALCCANVALLLVVVARRHKNHRQFHPARGACGCDVTPTRQLRETEPLLSVAEH